MASDGTVVHGTYGPRFADLVKALDDELVNGDEVGAALAVDVDGVSVIDVWGGYADGARSTRWAEDTIVNVWSSTKPVCVLAALILVDRGLLDLDAPVARYWPEFAANGKQDILVRHVLSHTSGVAGWNEPFTQEQMYDRAAAVARLADQAPWWTPGTQAGYHAQNYGHLVGEIVRRITGTSLTDFVRREIAEPLGADVQIGARAADDHRVAELITPPPIQLPPLPPDSPMRKVFSAPPAAAEPANTTAWRRAEVAACNGHTNARGLVRALSPIALGGRVNGVTLLRPETVDRIFDVHATEPDLVLGTPVTWGLGMALPTADFLPYLPTERTCFWGGWGGSLVVMDLHRRVTIAYTMNHMTSDLVGSDRTRRYLELVYKALDA
jgi:CubicO group peptidase (beta-lactamase class C family)